MDNSIFTTADGSHSILSGKFDVPYHSKHGAIQETQHVFIEAALYPKIEVAKELHILEIGFGTGLNALMTLLEAEQKNISIHYQTFELFPITIEQAKTLNYPAELNINPSTFQQLHEVEWNVEHSISPNFTFRKWKKDFQTINFKDTFDCIYFDAFAPNAQPSLWEAPLLQQMYEALKQEGVLTTYCAKGVVKRCLKSIGFDLEALSGPPGKREMTRAWKR